MRNILVIDDSIDFRETIQDILDDASYETSVASCPDEAFTLLRKESFDLIICDLHMPFTTGERSLDYAYCYEVGVRTIQELRWVYPDMPIIAITATSPSDLRSVMSEIESIPALTKPISASLLLQAVETSLDIGECVVCQ